MKVHCNKKNLMRKSGSRVSRWIPK